MYNSSKIQFVYIETLRKKLCLAILIKTYAVIKKSKKINKKNRIIKNVDL